jgi:type VI secretion system protein ImpB
MSSLQDKVGRVRPPRVQIRYDVETKGKMEKKELPFVVGVIADLSAESKAELKPLRDREVVDIDSQTLDTVMSKAAPRVALSVQNRLSDPNTKLMVELNFKSMEDFEPARIAEQVPALKKLLDARKELKQLLSKMEGNDELERLLADVLTNKDKAKAVAEHLGITSSEPGTETKS